MSNIDLKALVSQMTLQEKADQLFQLTGNFFLASQADITGPMTFFGLDEENLKNIGTILGTGGAETVIRIQEKHLSEDRNKIPMVFMRDIIHGYRTVYPIPLGMGASFDPELVEECSYMAAKESSVNGIQVTFTPMVDLSRDARWGRIMESCGEDPYLNSIMGAAQVKGFQGDDISKPDRLATCVKHFAAYGACESGRDYNSVELSERALREYHFPSYKACIDAGTKMVMPSLSALNGITPIENKWLLRNVLRDEWGFNGLVISDWNAIGELMIQGLADGYKECARLAFEAGCDIEMMSPAYHKHLAELVREGKILEEDLDAAVLRFLEFKEELGLFDDPYHGADPVKEKEILLCPEHREIARRAACESSVLLKNDGVLPFSKEVKKIALIGPFADTGSINGAWAGSGRDDECVTVKAGIERLLPNAEITVISGCGANLDDNDTSGFEEAVSVAKEADAVVLCLGELQKYSGESCSRVDLRLPGVQEELAKEVSKVNNNSAVLLFNGRPLVLTDIVNDVHAILEMWMPGTEGGSAAASLLFGEANPSGKLSVSFPKSVGQCPIYYNYLRTGKRKDKPDGVFEAYRSNYLDCGNLPLFFFGEGLSYTEFVYESMTLDKNELDENGEITVSVTVRNTGDRDGKEVVQLYLHDLVSQASRPVQELRGFEKVFLKAGESKTVTFKITEPQLRYHNFNCEYVSEKGDFTVSVGYADHMKFTEKFTLV